MQNVSQIKSQRRKARAALPAERGERGVSISHAEIEAYLDHLQGKGRVQGTLNWYRRSMMRLYDELPDEDKNIYRDTLKQWREKLVQEGYAPSTINQFMVVSNGYLEYAGKREYQFIEKLTLVEEIQPELTRNEYLRLLQTARSLGRERVYLLVKVFANTNIPLQELPKLTVEAAQAGRVNVLYNSARQVVRIPNCICQELLEYAKRKGILHGPIFLTRDGEPMSRTNVATGIKQLSAAARIPEEKGNHRCLRKLYLTTREGIERNIALLVEQAQERLLEDEQLSIGWE